MKETLIVIPALNEAATIEQVVQKAKAFGDVHVIDDGSTDQTAQKAVEAGATISRHIINKGYDDALATGITYAIQEGYYAVITVDADGQLPVERIADFIGLLKSGSDLVVGDRGPDLQRFSEILFSSICKKVMRLNDPFCGMKAYKLDLLRKIGFKNSYRSIGTETTMRILVNNGKHKNLSIEVASRDDASRMGGTITSELLLTKATIASLLYYILNKK